MYAMTDRLSILFEEYFKNILTSYKTQKTANECKSKRFQFNWTRQLIILLFCRQVRCASNFSFSFQQIWRRWDEIEDKAGNSTGCDIGVVE